MLKRINNNKKDFSFDELSKGIVLEAWSFLPYFSGPLTKIDVLFDLCLDLIEKSNNTLTAYSSEAQVIDFLEELHDTKLNKRIRNLCLIAPYRLDINESIYKNQKLYLEIYPAQVYSDTYTWSSSDESIATVNEDGVVTGISSGEATIYAINSQGEKVGYKVTVLNGNYPESISLDISELILKQKIL